jgi:hypothetical protein
VFLFIVIFDQFNKVGLGIEGYQNQGALFILDAQETYQSEDPRKM